MSEKKKYGLIIPSRVATKKPDIQPSSVFADDGDEKESESSVRTRNVTKAPVKRQYLLELEKAVADDPSVFEYDSIYDELQSHKTSFNKLQTASRIDRKPKYIDNLLKSAEQRKRNMERRIEKSVQKERESERGQFDDKESFVTDAYRRKVEEMKLDEERERQIETRNARMDVSKQEDMTSFYRNLLNESTAALTEQRITYRTATDDVDDHTPAHCRHSPSAVLPQSRDRRHDEEGFGRKRRAHDASSCVEVKVGASDECQQKQSRVERRMVGDALDSARARYMVRKSRPRTVAVVSDDV